MTQRERFDLVKRSIESLYCSTSVPFSLIYIDGCASSNIMRQSEALALQYDFSIVRREYFLPPNVARNLALNAIEKPTDYIVFVDNDVIFEAGWLESLVQCADETGAALVTPLIMIGNPERPETVRIHFAGGKIDIKETPKGARFFDSHNYGDQKLCEVKESLQRQVSDTVEFHTVLVRSDLMERVGPLDEDLRATSEHLDLSLQIKKLGEKIYFEPDSVVTYITGKPLEKYESNFFILRWSDCWAVYSERHFQKKWGFVSDRRVIDNFVVDHRLHGFPRSRRFLEKFLGYRYSRKLLAFWYRLRVLRARKYALPETLTY